MKTLLLGLLLATAAAAQNVAFVIDTSDGATPTSQLPALPLTYSFPDTSVGQTANVALRVVNISNAPLTVNAIYVGAAANSSSANNNFNVSGFDVGATLAPSAWKLFFVSFTPTVAGPLSGYLQVSVAGQSPAAVSTLSGNGLSSTVSLTCTDNLLSLCDGSTPIPPSTSLLFGGANGVALGATYAIKFALTNNTAAAIAKPVISTELYAPAAFTSPDLANVPASIAPSNTATFTIVFTPQATAPGPSSAQTATLTVGSATYALEGNVLIVANNNPPQITCVYSTGKPCQGPSNTSSTFSVGPDATTSTLIFSVTNTSPLGTAYADITLPTPPTISDVNDFTLSAPTLALTSGASSSTAVTAGQPVAIHPGYTLSFQVTFSGAQSASATLTIGTITYTLNGQPAPVVGSAQSDLPGITLMCGATPCSAQTFTSQQQVQATLQVNAATTAGATLAIAFKSLVSGVADPAVTFIAPFTQADLSFLFKTTSLSGMLSNGQPSFTFQTGTTAGTINFTLTDSATQQTINLPAIQIQPSKVQITSSTAVRSNPNLVLTITGYDNTYSAGSLSFTFYGVNGANLTPNAIQVDATSAFKQYFFGATNQAGGAFSLQVTFPVSGDVTQVGSVAATLTNSAGQTSLTQTFQ